MQSATSYFNRTLFRKNLQRFWPLWFGYTLIWLLALPVPMLAKLAGHRKYWVTEDVSEYILQTGAYGGLAMAVIFGIFFAMAVFAYLTSPRATQGFHAMPVRRETLYVTGYLSGLACMLSSLALTFALAGVTAACFGALDAATLGAALSAAVLAVLFFYSFGVLCMMFTGQILAAPVFYGILNVLAAGVEALVRLFAGNFLYGYSGYTSPDTLAALSPLWKLANTLRVEREYNYVYDSYGALVESVPTDRFTLTGLGLLGVYAAVGLALAALGLLVYKKRASEASGSIVTVPWARPIFKYGAAFCSALSLGQLIYLLVFGMDLYNGQYSLAGTIACMVFTGLFGYFGAEMLLQKSFRVWRTSRAGAAVFSVLLVCFGFCMSLDLTGYEGYTPDADEVQTVTVYLSSNGDYMSCALDERESIDLVLAAHRAMIADKERQLREQGSSVESGGDVSYLYFTVNYTLADGSTVRRSYGDCRAYAGELNEGGSVAQTMTALLNCPEAMLDRTLGDLADEEDAYLTGGWCDVVITDEGYSTNSGTELTAAQAETLAAALRRDGQSGVTASLFEDTRYSGGFYVELMLWWYSARGGVGLATEADDTTMAVNVTVTPQMTETLAALEDMGVETPASEGWRDVT